MPAPVTPAQREAIVSLLGNGTATQQIASHVGVTPGQVAAIKAHLSMGTYGNDATSVEAESDIATAFDTTFGLERDLQGALRRSIEQLEPGLTIVDGDKERSVQSGRIDITARDRDGTTVVIELKAVPADRDSIGQVLSYMGDLMGEAALVRGILIAPEFLPRTIAAARAATNIRLVKYQFRFSFETISSH